MFLLLYCAQSVTGFCTDYFCNYSVFILDRNFETCHGLKCSYIYVFNELLGIFDLFVVRCESLSKYSLKYICVCDIFTVGSC